MRLVVAKSQFEHKIKIPLVWGIFYYQTHKKTPAVARRCFRMPRKEGKEKKKLGILNQKNFWGPESRGERM